MDNINQIAVLMTCHNRKEKSLHCLHSLFNQIGLGLQFNVEVFLVDDGSTDGTSGAIMNQFPEVNIIQGNGNLYWNRGMHLAWKTAANAKDFDYYLWLNDDTYLFENAFKLLYKEKLDDTIICGTTVSKINNKSTYGGYISPNHSLVVPNGEFQNIDYCNGNCVSIPRSIYIKIGNLDPIFHHALGDFDYSLRARKIGISIRVAPEYVGFCEFHDSLPRWKSNSLNVFQRLKNLYSPLSGCYPTEIFVFEKRYHGVFLAILHVFSIHLRCLIPKLFK